MRQKDLSDAIGLEKVMTFEEWVRQECFKAPPEHSVDLAKSAWNHQQARIKALEKEQSAWRKFTDEANRTLEAADKKIASLLHENERLKRDAWQDGSHPKEEEK